MARSLASAKAAGTRFERMIADYLAENIDSRIDRRVKTGAKDKGDIANLRINDKKIVVEAKDRAKMQLSQWAAEAEQERINDEALAGIIIHKRHGKGQPEDQWVTMTLKNLVSLINSHKGDNDG